jgi:hypothetical protein
MDRSRLRLERRRVDALPREVLVDELRKVAEQLGGRRFSRRDFDRHASACKGSVVLSHFGSWAAALRSIGIPLRDYRPDRKQITDAQLLEELARVWSGLGHRPSKLEWEASEATYSYTTYKQRFGGWVNACAALVSGGIGNEPPAAIESRTRPSMKPPPERNRTVPLKLRLRVLTRDKFRCVFCGSTPAINPGTVLHVDHIVPFSDNGPTLESNLRTLCEKCNRGKGADREHAV